MSHHLHRSRRLLAGGVFGLLLVSGGLLTASAATPGTVSALVSIVPCRLLDTRTDNSAVGQAVTLVQPVTGVHGDCNIPSNAIGASMNVTIVNPTIGSFLTVWPADQPRPNASNL